MLAQRFEGTSLWGRTLKKEDMGYFYVPGTWLALLRHRRNRAGVCSGLREIFGSDPLEPSFTPVASFSAKFLAFSSCFVMFLLTSSLF